MKLVPNFERNGKFGHREVEKKYFVDVHSTRRLHFGEAKANLSLLPI